MNIREQIGGMAETALFALVDEIDGAAMKKKLHAEVDKFVDGNLEAIKLKLKQGIDKIDGEKDLPEA